MHEVLSHPHVFPHGRGADGEFVRACARVRASSRSFKGLFSHVGVALMCSIDIMKNATDS